MAAQETLTREQWLEERRTYIGGTDIAAIVGMNRWKTPLRVFLSKKGEAEDTSGIIAEIGIALEPLLLRYMAAEFGVEIQPGRTLRHPDYPFLAVNPDGFVGDQEVIEAKTFGYGTEDEWGGDQDEDEIPPQYHVQAQWEVGIARLNGLGRAGICRVGALHRDNGKFRRHIVHFDQDYFDMLVQEGLRFQREHIEANVPPSPLAGDIDYLKQKYPTDTGGFIIADARIEAVVERMKSLKVAKDAATEGFDDCKALLQDYMGENSSMASMEGPFTWRKAKDSLKPDFRLCFEGLLAYALMFPKPELIREEAARLLARNTESKPGSRRFLTPFKKERLKNGS